MKLNLYIILSLFLFVLGPSQITWSQEEPVKLPKQQIEFRHDNDFVLLTDEYYSSGLWLTYRRRLASGIFTKGREQLTFQLSQEAHTPSDIDTRELRKIDRPYAGFSGLSSQWSISGDHSLLEVKALIGLTGPSSGAGAFQRWHHRNVVLVSVPTWFTEIEDSFHANLEVSYAAEWQLAPVPFGVWFALQPRVAYGTRDIFVQPEFIASFGRRNPIGSTIAYNQVGAIDREVYFSLRFGVRYVGHNALLEGNLLGDNSLYTIEPKNRVTHIGFDFRHRSGKNDYTLGYRYNSKEAEVMDSHRYLILAFARSF
ncbi:MAG: lipid A-modifier LpxR family protein [Bacteroidota bacterium]